MHDSRRYYVYELVASSGWVFYVGKGTGRRAWTHGPRSGGTVGSTILALKKAGQSHEVRIVANDRTEPEALAIESVLLAMQRDVPLVNVVGCPRTLPPVVETAQPQPETASTPDKAIAPHATAAEWAHLARAVAGVLVALEAKPDAGLPGVSDAELDLLCQPLARLAVDRYSKLFPGYPMPAFDAFEAWLKEVGVTFTEFAWQVREPEKVALRLATVGPVGGWRVLEAHPDRSDGRPLSPDEIAQVVARVQEPIRPDTPHSATYHIPSYTQ